MSLKIACYGVRDTEKPIFLAINKSYLYDLVLIKDLLTHENVDTAKGCDAVLLRANCVADKQNLDILKSYGVSYVLTRTVGTNHIDIPYAKELGFKLANVPNYSPNSVSELAVSLGVGLLRNTFLMADKMAKKDFVVDDALFAQEIRNSTIGIVGTGRIGMEVAKAYFNMGANVIGYDLFPDEANKHFLDYVTFDELLENSDLISIHCPYIVNENLNMFSDTEFDLMKNGVCIVNTARGELINYYDLLKALKSKKVKSVALDTLKSESDIFFKKFDDELPISFYQELWELYPRVIFTPHIGSYTDQAVSDMVMTSYQNLEDLLTTNKCQNQL